MASFPKYRCNFGDDVAVLCVDRLVLMCNDFLLWPINLNCPSAVFGIITNLGEIISFALSFTLLNSDASIFYPPAQSLLPQEFLSKLFLPRIRRIRSVFRLILCSRIGGISMGQKHKWSDNHSNEPNKILWLNWFVEAPFLKYFSQIVAIHHGIHPPVKWSVATVTQKFLPLFSVPLFSNPIEFWTVVFRRLFSK